MTAGLLVDFKVTISEVLFPVLPQSSNKEPLGCENSVAEIHLSFESMLEIAHDCVAFDDLIDSLVTDLKVRLILQSLLNMPLESLIDETRSAQFALRRGSASLSLLNYNLLTVGHYFFSLQSYISATALDRINYCINSSSTGIEQEKSVVGLKTLVAMTCCWHVSYPDPVVFFRSSEHI